MRWTQVILSQLFAIAVLFSSTHAVVNFHLCQETVKTYGIFASAPGCSMAEMQGQCGTSETNKDGLKKRRCCQNVNFTYHESDYESDSKVTAPIQILPTPERPKPLTIGQITARWDSPIVYKPPNRRVDIQASFQVFLI